MLMILMISASHGGGGGIVVVKYTIWSPDISAGPTLASAVENRHCYLAMCETSQRQTDHPDPAAPNLEINPKISQMSR